MNCRSGDIARVFRVSPGWEWAMDKIVQVVTPVHSPWDDEIGWLLAEPMAAPFWGFYCFALDSCLKPIRDPGEDAVDESHAWLPPVPKTREPQFFEFTTLDSPVIRRVRTA